MKKLYALVLSLLLACSLVACGGGEPSSTAEQSPSESESPSSTSESSVASEDESSSTEVKEVVMPDVDGFEKTEAEGMITYTAADASTVVVQSQPLDDTVLKLFETKDATAESLLNQMVGEMANQMYPGATADGKFTTVSGKDTYMVSMNVPKGDDVPVDISMDIYVVPGSSAIYSIAAFSMGTDVDPVVTKVLEAI